MQEGSLGNSKSYFTFIVLIVQPASVFRLMLVMKTRGGGTGPLGKPRVQRKPVEDIVMILLAFFSNEVFLPLIFLFIFFLLLITTNQLIFTSEFVFQTTIKRHPDEIEILEIAFKSFRQVNTQKGNLAEKIPANVLNSPLILFFPSILSFFSKLSQFLANQKNVPIGFFFHALYWLQFRQVELNSQI